MKKVLLTTVFILTVTIVFGQNNLQDVVYLKNGSIIRGTIIEQVPNESLKVKTADGSIYVFTISDVEKMTKEPVVVLQQSTTAPQPMQQEQQEFHQKLQFGIKGGLNVANEMATDGTNSTQTNARIGIHIGFFVAIPMSAKFDFQPELLYSMQGGSYKDGATYTDKLDYINLPLIFKWYVWQRRLSIDFGPQFGYMISAKISSGGNSISFYDADELKKFDASLALGLSFKLTDKIYIGFRGTAGLTNMLEGDVNYTNNVSQINVTLRF